MYQKKKALEDGRYEHAQNKKKEIEADRDEVYRHYNVSGTEKQLSLRQAHGGVAK